MPNPINLARLVHAATVTTLNRWSNPATWVPNSVSPADLPQAGSAVIIPFGKTVYLDIATPSLGDLTISGSLIADRVNVGLTATSITVNSTGILQIGAEGSPYTQLATITLTGAEAGRVARYVPGQLTNTGVGNGRLARLAASTGAIAETITVAFSSATAFAASGSVSGALGSGTVGTLFNNKIRFIATAGTTAFALNDAIGVPLSQFGCSNSGGPRSLQVMDGGSLILIGLAKSAYRTKISANAADSSSSFSTVDNISGWTIGDEIAIGGTDFIYTTSGTPQRLVVNTASANSLTTKVSITGSRWGVLQYVTDTGMSLTPGTITKHPATVQVDWDAIPKVLDQQAMLINLTRSIVIQGVNDTAWQTTGFGVHMMFMGLTSVIKMKGVAVRRGGQAGANGRYPLHWHMASYNMPDGMSLPSDGTFLGAKTGDYFTDGVVDTSAQRAITLHGTHGIVIDRNVCYDITGHALFLEDGVEQNNFIRDNVVMKVKMPLAANQLVAHDTTPNVFFTVGSAGIWYTNPNNTLTGNWFNGCEGTGIWNSFSNQVFNLSSEVAVNAQATPILLHRDNTSSCNGAGMTTELVQNAASGTFTNAYYIPYLAGTKVNAEITSTKIWKNRFGGYLNRVGFAAYKQFVTADNGGRDFNGQAQSAVASLILSVSDSLNSATVRETSGRAWAASYHQTLTFKDCIVMGFKATAPVPSEVNSPGTGLPGGMIGCNDLYIQPMFDFTAFTGLKQINQVAPYRILPPILDGQPLASRNWTYAGAIKDINGNFVGAGQYWIFDHPFLTTGCSNLQPVLTEIGLNNGKSTPDKFYGVSHFFTSFDSSDVNFLGAITATRQDATGASVGQWVVPDGNTGTQFRNMRNFCMTANGRYLLNFPGNVVTSYAGMFVSNLNSVTEFVTLGVQFAATSTIATVSVLATDESVGYLPIATGAQVTAGQGRLLNNTGTTSVADVTADTTGTKYWHDKTNGICWVRLMGLPAYTPFKPSVFPGFYLSISV